MTTQTSRNNFRKKRIGIVLSDKMQKTIVVQIRRKALHPTYGKVVEHAVKFKAHDEKNEAKVGDRVLIQETRPLSKDKNWRLVEILEKGRGQLKKDSGASSDIKEVPGIAAVKPVTPAPPTAS